MAMPRRLQLAASARKARERATRLAEPALRAYSTIIFSPSTRLMLSGSRQP